MSSTKTPTTISSRIVGDNDTSEILQNLQKTAQQWHHDSKTSKRIPSKQVSDLVYIKNQLESFKQTATLKPNVGVLTDVMINMTLPTRMANCVEVTLNSIGLEICTSANNSVPNYIPTQQIPIQVGTLLVGPDNMVTPSKDNKHRSKSIKSSPSSFTNNTNTGTGETKDETKTAYKTPLWIAGKSTKELETLIAVVKESKSNTDNLETYGDSVSRIGELLDIAPSKAREAIEWAIYEHHITQSNKDEEHDIKAAKKKSLMKLLSSISKADSTTLNNANNSNGTFSIADDSINHLQIRKVRAAISALSTIDDDRSLYYGKQVEHIFSMMDEYNISVTNDHTQSIYKIKLLTDMLTKKNSHEMFADNTATVFKDCPRIPIKPYDQNTPFISTIENGAAISTGFIDWLQQNIYTTKTIRILAPKLTVNFNTYSGTDWTTMVNSNNVSKTLNNVYNQLSLKQLIEVNVGVQKTLKMKVERIMENEKRINQKALAQQGLLNFEEEQRDNMLSKHVNDLTRELLKTTTSATADLTKFMNTGINSSLGNISSSIQLKPTEDMNDVTTATSDLLMEDNPTIPAIPVINEQTAQLAIDALNHFAVGLHACATEAAKQSAMARNLLDKQNRYLTEVFTEHQAIITAQEKKIKELNNHNATMKVKAEAHLHTHALLLRVSHLNTLIPSSPMEDRYLAAMAKQRCLIDLGHNTTNTDKFHKKYLLALKGRDKAQLKLDMNSIRNADGSRNENDDDEVTGISKYDMFNCGRGTFLTLTNAATLACLNDEDKDVNFNNDGSSEPDVDANATSVTSILKRAETSTIESLKKQVNALTICDTKKHAKITALNKIASMADAALAINKTSTDATIDALKQQVNALETRVNNANANIGSLRLPVPSTETELANVCQTKGMCYDFQRNGNCVKGDNCESIHDVRRIARMDEVDSNNTKTNPWFDVKTTGTCFKWKYGKSCTYGSSCKYKHDEAGTSKAEETTEESIKVYVGNLNSDQSKDELEKLFGTFGGSMKGFSSSKGFSFIHFKKMEDAKIAIKKLHGTKFGGRTLKVQLSKPSK